MKYLQALLLPKLFLFFTVFNIVLYASGAANKVPEVGIQEKLGYTLNLNKTFTDSDGNKINLRTLVNKPTILLFAFYNCPKMCIPFLADVGGQLTRLKTVAGKDYQVVTISISPNETFQIANAKKKYYMAGMDEGFDPRGWRFLVGDSSDVIKLASDAGFYYKKVGDSYDHPSVMIIISEKGIIKRYLHGPTFQNFDIQMGLLDASNSSSISTKDKFLSKVFIYDKDLKRYMFNVSAVIGSSIFFIFLIVTAFVVVRILKKTRTAEM